MKKLFLTIATLFVFSGFSYAGININTATQSELETLQGIGPAKAKAIIEYREEKGPLNQRMIWSMWMVLVLVSLSNFVRKSPLKLKLLRIRGEQQ